MIKNNIGTLSSRDDLSRKAELSSATIRNYPMSNTLYQALVVIVKLNYVENL